MAAMSGSWLRKKVRHPWLGGPRRLTMYLATLDCAMSNPSLSSSPWMRGAPQSGFSMLLVLCFKPQLRLEWRGQDGQNETKQPDHSASLGDSITSSTRIRFSVHTGLTPQQVLRSLVLMRVKNWDYRELRERIADGYTLRQFTDFHSRWVPRHDAFHRGFTRLTPATLKAINELVVAAAVDLELEDGRQLRVDTTVVQSNIHHPTDNTLLWDVVRVITRLIARLAAALERRRIKGFRDRTRSARRRMLEIQRMTTRQRQEQQTGKYRELIGIAEEVLQSARMVLRNTRKTLGRDMIADMVIAEARKEIEHFCDLGSGVINQSRRRVLNGEQVPTAAKIYSIFEPHTDLIKRGKVQTPIEFGHKVFLAESARGLITQYEVLNGNPVDEQHVVPSLKHHKQAFGYAPDLYGGDRGFFSEHNVASCKQDGVKVVCIPQRGGAKTPEREAYEKSSQFKNGQRFRAGIEGRISVLFRGRGMKRCLAEGRERFEMWVAAAVLANNLMKVADLLMQRSSRKRKAA